jgi:hypothetical protein
MIFAIGRSECDDDDNNNNNNNNNSNSNNKLMSLSMTLVENGITRRSSLRGSCISSTRVN